MKIHCFGVALVNDLDVWLGKKYLGPRSILVNDEITFLISALSILDLTVCVFCLSAHSREMVFNANTLYRLMTSLATLHMSQGNWEWSVITRLFHSIHDLSDLVPHVLFLSAAETFWPAFVFCRSSETMCFEKKRVSWPPLSPPCSITHLLGNTKKGNKSLRISDLIWPVARYNALKWLPTLDPPMLQN